MCTFMYVLAPNFIKPKIDFQPENSTTFPRPLPPPPPFIPPPVEDDLAAKHEYQQKLTLASQQLDPSVPSILLCTVHPSDNTW